MLRRSRRLLITIRHRDQLIRVDIQPRDVAFAEPFGLIHAPTNETKQRHK